MRMNRKLTICCLLAALAILSGCGKKTCEITWDDSIVLPGCDGMEKNIGLAGAFSGLVGDELILVGGANFPEKYPWGGGKKVWWNTLYAYNRTKQAWNVYDNFLNTPLAYGVSIQLPEGVLCIGGCNADGCSDKALLIKKENDTYVIDSLSYPPLPVPLANMAAALLNGKIYVAGGQESVSPEQSTHHFFMLDLARPMAGWQKLPAWPGPSRGYAVAVAQRDCFYLFSGRSYAPDEDLTVHTDGYVYMPAANQWRRLSGTFPFMAGTAIPYGEDKILFLGGVERIIPGGTEHPGFSNEAVLFDVTSESVLSSVTSPSPLAVTTQVLRDGNDFYIASGEVKPGVRTPIILKGKLAD